MAATSKAVRDLTWVAVESGGLELADIVDHGVVPAGEGGAFRAAVETLLEIGLLL